ncbi:hypothetical protein HPO96_04585 [Kribbella sandramycini]|uniref:Uncharacterized protein n=1 Tax=Kribbella sandramycini TaxID=60450 RepID=A0A7Y4KVN9_9ACTN|nr:hypothetical protein [Kribbella sandramycini]MBB6567888.1 hypothetical protein [Kribbella sandramycini]NOL39517.1 hypothetical protein [Kribbella sandramycini]
MPASDPALAGAAAVALTGLAEAYRPRPITPLLPWRDPHRLVKPYIITARGRQWDDHMVALARTTASRQLDFDDAMGAVGLAVVVLHLGDDGIYLVVQSWSKDFQSRLSLFSGHDVDDLRPAPLGAAPCVWELEVLSHERAAYVEHILSNSVDVDAWLEDALDTRPQPKLDGIPSGV